MAEVQIPAAAPAERVAKKVLLHMQMCAADLEQFGGPADGWLTFDTDYVDDLPARDLIAIERAARDAGEPINLLPSPDLIMGEDSMRGVSVKAKLFLARRQAGYVDKWADFQPRLGHVRYRVEPVFDEPAPEGGDPLAEAGSATSSTGPAAAPSPTG